MKTPYYNFSVEEEQPIGTILTKIQAYDTKATTIQYTLKKNSYYEINNNTGNSTEISANNDRLWNIIRILLENHKNCQMNKKHLITKI